MTPKFCHNCGKQAAPGWKACPFCETSFASLSEKPKVHTREEQSREATVVAARRGGDDDDDDNYLDHERHYQPKIEALAVEIQKPRQSNVESIKDLATNPFSNVSTEARVAPPTLSPEEAIRQFQQEAGNAPRPQSNQE